MKEQGIKATLLPNEAESLIIVDGGIFIALRWSAQDVEEESLYDIYDDYDRYGEETDPWGGIGMGFWNGSYWVSDKDLQEEGSYYSIYDNDPYGDWYEPYEEW